MSGPQGLLQQAPQGLKGFVCGGEGNVAVPSVRAGDSHPHRRGEDAAALDRRGGADACVGFSQQIQDFFDSLDSSETISTEELAEALEEMLGEWAENNARSLARAEIYLANKKQAYLEMKRLMQTAGLSRSPSNDDVGKYEGWKDRFSAEILSFAAECANGKGKPIPYMEKLLSEWEKSNISTLEAAREDHSRAAAKAPEKAARQNYQQHDYTEDDFKDIFYDPAKDYGEGGEQQ